MAAAARANPARAASLFEQACDTGEARGCYNLALLHGSGRGVSRDASRASALFVRACQAGYEPACGR